MIEEVPRNTPTHTRKKKGQRITSWYRDGKTYPHKTVNGVGVVGRLIRKKKGVEKP